MVKSHGLGLFIDVVTGCFIIRDRQPLFIGCSLLMGEPYNFEFSKKKLG